MASQAGTLDGTIRRIVEEHYSTGNAPLMLAELGQKLRDSGLEVPGEKPGNLKRYIESQFPGDLAVARHDTIGARVAVCPLDRKKAVEKVLNSDFAGLDGELARLPRAVLFAFCRSLPEGVRVFQGLEPPFRYTTDPDEAARSKSVEVDQDLRLPQLRIPAKGPPVGEDAEKLKARIDEWAGRHGVDLSRLVHAVTDGRTAEKTTGHSTGVGATAQVNALHRLIQAQPSKLRHQFVIPADIADILMRHR